jgi:DNA-binding cell septation regulator SpoVG
MINVTKVTSFPVTGTKSLKAKGVVTLNDMVELKYLVIEGGKGPFVSWEGTTTYDKKDGSGKGYNSPVFVKDKSLNETITKAVLEKYKNGGQRTTGTTTTTPAVDAYSNDASFAADDIPF